MTEKENALKVIHRELPDWLPCYTKCTKYLMTDFNELEKPQMQEGYDWFGVHWLSVAAIGGLTHPDTWQKPLISNIANWKQELKFPDLDKVDWDTIKKQMEEQKKEAGDGVLHAVMLEHGLFERLTLLLGYENAMVALYEEPEACIEYCGALADFKIKLIDRLLECSNDIDMFDYHDDLGSAGGLLMSPEKWREIFRYNTKRIVDYVHNKGKLFFYHTCGKVDKIFGDLVELEPDVINLIQACNDQEYIKHEFGDKVVLQCGLDNQTYFDIENPNEEDVRKEVRRSIDVLAPGGNFFAGLYLPGTFAGNGLDVCGIIEDEILKVGKDYYKKEVL
jgi:hypothetical protein